MVVIWSFHCRLRAAVVRLVDPNIETCLVLPTLLNMKIFECMIFELLRQAPLHFLAKLLSLGFCTGTSQRW